MDTMSQILKLLEKNDYIEINEFRMDVEELELTLMPTLQKVVQKVAEKQLDAKKELENNLAFKYPVNEYPGKVNEVLLGGKNRNTVKLGGQNSLYRFEEPQPNAPVVTFDVFDIPMKGLPRPIKENFEEVMDSPGEWARKAVKEFGADMITLHLIGTDPKVKDKSLKDASKDLEEVLQAVKVPLVIGGSGNPQKDPLVLEMAAEVADGERCLLASANLDLDYQKIARAAVKHNHAVLSWAISDINMQKVLNKALIKEGLTPNDIVMDPTTCALGYGIEFSIDVMTRTRLAALKGEEILQMPMSSGTTNAWGSREAWMKKDEWGPTKYRGPIWEVVTGLTMMLCGVDIFMMLHPLSVKTLKEIGSTLTKEYKSKESQDISEWISKF
ncbi:CO dehydrogenase/acetyl-CoA synthase, delta subunit [Methanococcus vannielii SB]|uniref:Acetyl-CoA decarbonylase/synthase complex subunit delta n=1 Tax=Methanococcus vannielii (strain ATCC 35089 / DSM 1224 / JCM 13029 / OCM 148 / SB) TaxID=406327 RepID=A6UNZ4_METVS|nr:CO dehydrogenase/acetyl-CoA synthase subunit delta [Methanococcus vannielii]ABR54216.1 CO dehydrogenase/acetyl-CoA synthase, delta subunit [Methanococcus vannielii SB]